MKSFIEAVKARRTYYTISNEKVISNERIQEIVNEAVKHAPSSFNSQSARVVILLGEQHHKIWDLTKSELKKIVPANAFQATEDKINSCFRSGYGTLLFFEDEAVIEGLQKQFPSYKDAFPMFSHHSAGMLQYILWTALELEGFGASLQHYNPVIDNALKAEWKLPQKWKLLAQMPFGKPTAAPSEKTFLPLEDRVKIFK